ncbi:hypothetical protein Tco_0830917 [Tanacetum coccineum]
MTILTLLMHLKSHSSSIRTPVKILNKVLYILTTIIVTGVVIRQMVRCTCESCGNGAHYGYNCPPKVPIISNSEPCYNQNVDEFPQTLPSFHSTCYSGDENSFTYDFNLNFVDDSPNPPPQSPTYSYEFCGNDAHYGHDCPLQVPFIYNPEPCYNQDFNFPQNFQSFQQQYICCTRCEGPHETFQCQQVIFYEPCCENYGGPHATFECQPMNQNFYDPNSSGFNQFQPSQSIIDHIKNHEDFQQRMNDLMIELRETFQAGLHERQEQVVKLDSYTPEPSQCQKIPIYYDDEESSVPLRDIIIFGLPPCVAITPDLLITDSLIMEDKHLDTISATESDKVIKSSVEDIVPIPSESEGIPDNMCDVPFRDNSPPLDISKDQFEYFSDSNDDSTSIDDDSFSIDDIDYVEASPPHSELVSLEEVKDFHPEDGELEDDVLREKLSKIDILIAKIEALNVNLTPSFDFVLKSPIPVEDGDSFLEKFETTPELETFKFDIEEKNNGSTTIHADISLPDLECFYFKSEPDPADLTSIIDPGIRENVSSTTNVNLPFEDDQSPLFAYVVWIFLPFLTYPVAPPYLLSSRNEDTIFDPDISVYYSFMPDVSHRSGTFMKFNVYPNHLNESPMEILSSTCSYMDQ